MTVKTVIKKNTYFDSVSLMTLSTKANKIEGIRQAVVAMGTALNKEVLHNVGLYSESAEQATPGDLMIIIEAEDEAACDEALIQVEELFIRKDSGDLNQEIKFSSMAAAVKRLEKANLAIISVPGAYAFREAKKALENGLNVMIFSDNVALDQELALKQMASEKGLLVMGPDCGTAIIGGKGLCFANEVRRGNIGIVAASGTGAQEVSVRIDDFGGGVSHLIGTGGRDLSETIGGISMLAGLQALEEDPSTEVILLLSKIPAVAVAEKIYSQVKSCSKPVVICFLGGQQEKITAAGAVYAKTTKEAALKAVVLAGGKEEEINTHPLNLPLIKEIKAKLRADQKYIRGLFCGGTVCQEVMGLVREKYPNVYSNIGDPAYRLADVHISKDHTMIDFGDDAFTQGRPHPMIDPSLRIERFLKEAADPAVGVIAMDFILGYGAHNDPAGIMLPHIRRAKLEAAQAGRHLEILAFVLGTEKDPQNFSEQVRMLMKEGVTIASSVVNTGLLAAGFVEKEAQ